MTTFASREAYSSNAICAAFEKFLVENKGAFTVEDEEVLAIMESVEVDSILGMEHWLNDYVPDSVMAITKEAAVSQVDGLGDVTCVEEYEMLIDIYNQLTVESRPWSMPTVESYIANPEQIAVYVTEQIKDF